MQRFADKTSLQGVRFIEDAGRWYSRAMWTAFFVGALLVSTWQMYYVFSEFLSYPVSTKIQLGYDTLDFPSVTICNVNPLRMSQLDDFPEMKDFVDELSGNWNPELSSDEFEFWLGGSSSSSEEDQPAPSEQGPGAQDVNNSTQPSADNNNDTMPLEPANNTQPAPDHEGNSTDHVQLPPDEQQQPPPGPRVKVSRIILP